MIHNLGSMGYESYEENPCQFKNELVQFNFNCSIFIFYFQKLSFSNKSHQTPKIAACLAGKVGLSYMIEDLQMKLHLEYNDGTRSIRFRISQ